MDGGEEFRFRVRLVAFWLTLANFLYLGDELVELVYEQPVPV